MSPRRTATADRLVRCKVVAISHRNAQLRELVVNTSDESAWPALAATFLSGSPQSLDNDRYGKLGDRLTQIIERNWDRLQSEP